ncbi:MAG: hypothetical protein R3200_13465 [Xanthomonadales bacterium]|nr:hypothetical protein [Xanthomonadales bacterium]
MSGLWSELKRRNVLEAAVEAGFRSWWLMENDVRFGELRDQQAYQRLVESIPPLL